MGSYAIVPTLAAPAGKLSNYAVATTNGSLIITPQTANPVADTYYTGANFYWTTSPTSNTATLNLVATLRNNFNYAGDIRTAKVSFYVRSGTTLTPINGAQNLPVGLVNPSDLSVGTAAANVQYAISGKAATLDIAVLISGNYRTVGLPIDKEITVAVPTPGGLIAGGGTFDAAGATTTGAGYVKGSASFAFYVQYNKSLKNPQGGTEVTVTSYNDRNGNPTAALHTYKLRSNAISTLSTTSPTAQFSSKANLAEVTSTGGQSIEVKRIMQLDMYAGYRNPAVPSTTDKLAITVHRNGGGSWYSSAWDGTKTVVRDVAHRDEITVTGAGSSAALVTTTTTTASRSAAATPAPVASAAATTLLEVYPLPLTAQGTIHFQPQQDGPAQVQVYNAVGALVATLHSAPTTAGQDYYVSLSAEKLANGICFCRLVSAGKVETRRFVIQH